ncbi:MAG: hypothetical protein NVSMB17_19930 [Candidatus Dormibacteria bacterium]
MAIRHRRWPQALLAVIAARLRFDPQTYPYYGSGLLAAAAAADLLKRRRTLPVWTLTTGAWVTLDAATGTLLSYQVYSVARAVICLVTLLAVGWPPARHHNKDTPGTGRSRPDHDASSEHAGHPAPGITGISGISGHAQRGPWVTRARHRRIKPYVTSRPASCRIPAAMSPVRCCAIQGTLPLARPDPGMGVAAHC